jgi:hypothetical protein
VTAPGVPSGLTEDAIAEGMARAWKAACTPGDDRCYDFAYSLDEARKTCTPKGRCCLGWIAADSGRKAWYVWLDLHRPEGTRGGALAALVRLSAGGVNLTSTPGRHIPQITVPALLEQPERDSCGPAEADDGQSRAPAATASGAATESAPRRPDLRVGYRRVSGAVAADSF